MNIPSSQQQPQNLQTLSELEKQISDILSDENDNTQTSSSLPHTPLCSPKTCSIYSPKSIYSEQFTPPMRDIVNPANSSVSVGQNALWKGNQTSQRLNCVAVGFQALAQAVGLENTAVGCQSQQQTNTGEQNTSLGFATLENNIKGHNNTALGHRSLFDNNADNNTACGAASLRFNIKGHSNTALGVNAIANCVNGSSNTALGANSMIGLLSGTHNVAVGVDTQRSVVDNIQGVVAVGAQALMENQAGFNTAVGYHALKSAQTGSSNTALGVSAMENCISASHCTGVGHQTLQNAWGNYNTAVGSQAMSATASLATENVAVGSLSLHRNAGNRNVSVGTRAMTENKTGHHNVSMGYRAMANSADASYNVCVGSQSALGLQSGSGNTIIGFQSGPTGTDDINSSICLGAGATATASGELSVGSAMYPLATCRQLPGTSSSSSVDHTNELAPALYLNITVNNQKFYLPLYKANAE